MSSKNKLFVPHFNYVLSEISDNICWKYNNNKEILINKNFLIKKLSSKNEEYCYYKEGQLVSYGDSFLCVESIRCYNILNYDNNIGKKEIKIEIYNKDNIKFYILKLITEKIRFCKFYLRNINNKTKILSISGYHIKFYREERISHYLSNSISLVITESFIKLNNLPNKLRLIKQYYMFNEKQIKKLPKKLIYVVVNNKSIKIPTKPIKNSNIIFNSCGVKTIFLSKLLQ